MAGNDNASLPDTPEALQNALNVLSAEIGRQRRQGLSCDQLIQEHRDLTARLRQLVATPRPSSGGLVRQDIPDLEADGVREAWDDLLCRSNASSPSMSWEWLHSWWQHFGRGHVTCIEAVVDSASGNLVGLLPMIEIRPREVSWRLEGWIPGRHLAVLGTRLGAEVDYTSPLIAADANREEVAGMLLEAIAERRLPFVANHWDWGDEGARALVTTAHASGFHVVSQPRPIAYDSLPASFEQYVSQVPSPRTRTYIRDYTRRGWLADGEFAMDTCEEVEAIVTRFSLLREFSVAKYGSFSIWRLPSYRRFVETCVEVSAPKGWPVMWLLEHRGDPVAVSLGWVYRNTCFISAMTHDVRKRDFSPGHVLLCRIIGQLIERGVKSLDMHSAEGYKTHYLRQRRTRSDPLVLCPPGASHEGALAGMLVLGALRKRARAVALRVIRSRTQAMSETSGDPGAT